VHLLPADIGRNSGAGTIFIGYRKHDSQGFAGRLADDLSDVFGDEQIFRDDELPEGQDFTQVLSEAVSSSSVFLAVIGPDWLNARDESGGRRLDRSDDWVRREIEEAFARDVWVIPVLVGGAAMPAVADLPPSIAKLARVQGVVTSDRSWDEDVRRLIGLLRRRMPLPEPGNPLVNAAATRKRSSVRAVLGEWTHQAARTARAHRYGFGRRGVAATGAALIMRAFSAGVVLLLIYFILERYADADVRTFVYGFLAFTWEFVRSQFDRLAATFR
jgi:hypothetical protein